MSNDLATARGKSVTDRFLRNVTEGELLEAEKDRTMLELEIKAMKQRHTSELSRKQNDIQSVSPTNYTS